MVINLKDIVFDNDIFSTDLPNGSILVLNKIEESFLSDNFVNAPDTQVNRINIEVILPEGDVEVCPSVIGLDGGLVKIDTKYEEYVGKVLRPDNLQFCTIEVKEDDI